MPIRIRSIGRASCSVGFSTVSTRYRAVDGRGTCVCRGECKCHHLDRNTNTPFSEVTILVGIRVSNSMGVPDGYITPKSTLFGRDHKIFVKYNEFGHLRGVVGGDVGVIAKSKDNRSLVTDVCYGLWGLG